MKESVPSNPLGTLENPIVDSEISLEEALRPNPEFILPEGISEQEWQKILEKQIVVPVKYLSLEDSKYHAGQIVIHEELKEDLIAFFDFCIKQNFPLGTVIPIVHFNFDDKKSMEANNCSGFCARNIKGTDRPSHHAFGIAIDINPMQNPFIKGKNIKPAGAEYIPEKPGTLTAEIVEFLKKRGWKWGGDFIELKDYHHFEKLLKKIK